MEWHIGGDLPIYSQLVDQIKLSIITGASPPGSRLPSVRELAADAGVNPNTMQRALSELERSGLVHSQRTSGRFVTEDTDMIECVKAEVARGHVREFLHMMERLGYSGEQIISLLNSISKEDDGDAGNGV